MAQQGSPRVGPDSFELVDRSRRNRRARLVPKQLKDEFTMARSQLTKKRREGRHRVGIAVVGLAFLVRHGRLTDRRGHRRSGTAATDLVLGPDGRRGGPGPGLIFLLIRHCGSRSATPWSPRRPSVASSTTWATSREGNAFSPAEFDRLEALARRGPKAEQARQAERRKQAERGEQGGRQAWRSPQASRVLEPSYDELRRRTQLRRQHLGDIRSGLEEKTDVKRPSSTPSPLGWTSASVRCRPGRRPLPPLRPTAPAHAGEKANEAGEYVKDRWRPLALLGLHHCPGGLRPPAGQKVSQQTCAAPWSPDQGAAVILDQDAGQEPQDETVGAGRRDDIDYVVTDQFWTVPNILTLLRFGLVPVLAWCWWPRTAATAFIVLMVLSSTDWVDGYIARRFNQISTTGQWLDPPGRSDLADGRGGHAGGHRDRALVAGLGIIVPDLICAGQPW